MRTSQSNQRKDYARCCWQVSSQSHHTGYCCIGVTKRRMSPLLSSISRQRSWSRPEWGHHHHLLLRRDHRLSRPPSALVTLFVIAATLMPGHDRPQTPQRPYKNGEIQVWYQEFQRSWRWKASIYSSLSKKRLHFHPRFVCDSRHSHTQSLGGIHFFVVLPGRTADTWEV